MACYLSWNSKPSTLAAALEQKYGEDVRDRVMSAIDSQEFAADYGVFKDTSFPSMPVDTEGKEPTLEWLEKTVPFLFPNKTEEQSEFAFNSKNDAYLRIAGGYNPETGNTDKPIKTGTVVNVAGELYTVYNEEDEDMRLDSISSGKLSGSSQVTQIENAIREQLPKEIADIITVIEDAPQDILSKDDFINHSGGAIGYDAEWDLIGNEFGFTKHKHYLLPSDGAVSDSRLRAKGVIPSDATIDIGHIALTGQATGEGQIKITQAERQMGRIGSTHTTRNTKKIRNWAQVKNADAVFAIGSLVAKGEKITISRGSVEKIALIPQVNGGTSGAVQMAINEGKPVYVFNQVEGKYTIGWYVWNSIKKDFIPTDTPVLTKNFAGVGTSSNTTELGKQAIRAVYKKTLKEGVIATQNAIPAKVSESTSPIESVKAVQHTDLSKMTKLAVKALGAQIKRNDITEAHREAVKAVILKEIIEVAKAKPNESFVVNYVNPWNREAKFADANGFTQGDYARAFAELGEEHELPKNLHFYPAFLGLMQSQIKWELESIIRDTSTLWNLNEEMSNKLLAKVEIPIVNANGVTKDFVSRKFGATFQVDGLDTITYLIYSEVLKTKADSEVRIGIILSGVLKKLKHTQAAAIATGKMTVADKLEVLIESFAFKASDPRVSFLSLGLKRMEQMGFKIKEENRRKLLDRFSDEKYWAVEKDQKIDEEQVEFRNNIASTVVENEEEGQVVDENEENVSLNRGEGISDWSKISFETDARDTASARMKMWLSSMIEQETFSRDEDGNITGTVPKKNSIGFTKMVELDDLLAQILNVTSSVYELDGAKAIKLLRDSGNPTLWALSEKLAATTKDNQKQKLNEFIKVVSLQYGRWFQINSQLLQDSDGNEFLQTRIIDSQRSGGIGELIRYWRQSLMLAPMMKVREDGSRVMNLEKAQIQKKFFDFYAKLRNKDQKAELEKEFNEIKQSVASIYDGDFQTLWNDEYDPSLKQSRTKGKFRYAPAEEKARLQEEALIEGRSPYVGTDEIEYSSKEPKRKVIGKILQTVFDTYGILLDEDTISSLVGTFKKDGKTIDNIQGISGKGDWFSQFEYNKDKTPRGTFSAFFGQAAAILKSDDAEDIEYSEEEEDAVTINNPLYLQGSAMKVLAQMYLKHNKELHVPSFKNIEGKKIFAYSLNTSLSKLVQNLTQNFDQAKLPYLDSVLISNPVDPDEGAIQEANASFYLRMFESDGKKKLKRFGLTYLNGLNHGGRARGTTRAGMSDREQLLAGINLFLNNGRDVANFLSLTHADKTMTPLFYGVPKLDTGDSFDDHIESNVLNEFYEIFKGEMRRILNAQAVGDFNDVRYNEGAKHFFFLPFNKEDFSDTPQGELDKALFYNSDGSFRTTLTSDMESRAKQLITAHLQSEVKDNEEKFLKNDIDSKYIDRVWKKGAYQKLKQQQKALQARIDSNPENRELRDQLRALVDRENQEELMFKQAIKSFTINSMLWNVNSTMLFFGDPALTWKTNVKGTLLEYSKRLAKDIAPGQDLHWDVSQKKYRAITLTDANFTYPYLKGMGSNVVKSNATDAQEFTTVQEHLDVMMAAGLIEDSLYKELSKIIRDGVAKDGYYEFSQAQIDRMMQPMNPMKPVVAGFSRNVNGAMFYDYVKSSAYPLFPQFTKGMEMDKLRKVMEGKTGNEIQRANFDSAKKIGIPTKSLEFLNNDTERANDWTAQEIEAATQTMDRKNFRIQQDVPYDQEKDHIGIVSQMNKLIVEGIQDLKAFRIGTSSMDGPRVREFKEQLRSKMVQKGYEDFMRSIGAKKNENGRYGALDKQKFLDLLRHEATNRGYSENDLALLSTLENGDLDFPIFLHPAIEKFESLVMSMIKKITEFKIPGKSYVQVSSAGYQTIRGEAELKKSNIVFVDPEKFDGSTPLQHARVIDGIFYPAQVYAPFNFQYEENGKTVIAKIEDFMLKEGDEGYVEGRKQLNLKRVPKELLQLVGARIPNQGHNSMLPIEIVGFVPDIMGDALFVPSPITEQMGSDFDVDKLYTYKRPYEYNSFTKEFTQIEFKEDPSTDEEIQQAYFDTHWGVLSHPEMINHIVNKLDNPDLNSKSAEANLKDFGVAIEGANRKYASKKVAGSFWNPVNQMEQFQRGKDAKALVALTSLAVTLNSVLQDKDIRLGNYQWNPEKVGWEENPLSLKVNGLTLTTVSGYGKRGARTKHINHTIYQSAAVDNAKDRTLDNLNITLATFPALQALHQLEDKDGRIVNPDFAIAMTVQEVLWEFSSELKKGNDSLSTEFNAKLQDAVLGKLKTKYEKLYEDVNGSPLGVKREVELNVEALDKVWRKGERGTKDAEYYKMQLQVLETFGELLKVGKRLGELQKTLNQDTKGAGPSLLYAKQQAENFRGLTEKHSYKVFVGEDTLVGNNESTHVFEAIIPTAEMIAEFILPPSIEDLFRTISRNEGKQFNDMSLAQQRDIVRQLRSSMLSSSPMLSLGSDSTAERKRLMFDTPAGESLAKRVIKWRRNNTDNYFVNRLVPEVNPRENGPDTITYENAKAVRMDESLNVSDFTKLLTSKDEETRRLGQDLVKYALLLNPQNGPNSFVSKIPVTLLLSTTYSSDMRNSFENYSRENFMRQLYQHVPSLALEVSEEILKENDPINNLPGMNFPEVITIGNTGKFRELIEVAEIKGETILTPFLRFFSKKEGRVILYEMVTSPDMGYTRYVRIDTLGTKSTVEYNNQAEVVRSAYIKNRALFVNEFSRVSVMNSLSSQADTLIEKSSSGNTFADWGLTETGNLEDVQIALANMSTDRRLPRYYQTVARAFHLNRETVDYANRIVEEFSGKKPKEFSYEISEKTERGSFSYESNSLGLTPTTDFTDAAETLLHEYGHMQTGALAIAFGFYKVEAGKQTAYDVRCKEMQEKYPETYEKLKVLDRLRYEAYTKFTTELEKKGIDVEQMKKEVASNQLFTPEHEILYGLSDLSEFIAAVFSNKGTMQYLNSIETETDTRNFVERLIDAILDILSEVSSFIGESVKEKSVLKQALSLSYGITQLSQDETLMMFGTSLRPQTVALATIQQAERLQSTVEDVYGKETSIEDKGTHFDLNIKMNRNTTADPSITREVRVILDKMRGQLKALDATLGTTPKTEEEKARHAMAQRIHQEIEDDVKNLQATKDLMTLRSIGAKQLEWASKILKSPNPHFQEVVMATTLINLWKGLDVLYQNELIDDPNKEFDEMKQQLEHESKLLYVRLRNFAFKAWKAVAAKRGAEITTEDFGINLKELDPASSLFYTLSTTANKAIQLYTSIAQEAANNAEEAGNDLEKKLLKVTQVLKDYAKARGMKLDDVYKMFIQENTEGSVFGLVSMLHANWGKENNEFHSTLKDALESADKSLKEDSSRLTSRKKAFERFWKKMEGRGKVVGLRKLLDMETGERLSTPEAETEYNALIEYCGEKSIVDEVLKKASEEFKYYLRKKEDQMKWLEENEPDENERKRRLSNWETVNSPIEFARTINQNAPSSLFFHRAFHTPPFIPKKGNNLFDKKYQDIQSSPELKSAYEEFVKLSKQFKSYLPPSISQKMDDSFLPIITAETVSEVFNLYSALSANKLMTKVYHSLSITEAQKNRVAKEGIPLYLANTNATSENIATASRDIPRIMEMFGKMAIHYRYMYPVQQMTEVLMEQVRAENQTRLDDKKEGLTKLLDGLKYYKDMLVDKRSRKHEGKSDKASYSPYYWENRKIRRRVLELTTEIEALKEKIKNDASVSDIQDLSDILELTEDQKRLEGLQKELEEIQKDARYYAGSKVGDTLIGINQLKALSYNPFSGISNFAFGVLSGFIHAKGFRADKENGYTSGDFTSKQFKAALSLMRGNYAHSIFRVKRTVTAQKIKNLLDRIGLIDTFIDTTFDKAKLSKAERSEIKKTLLDPMAWQKSGDFVSKGALALAMILNREVEVTIDGMTKKIPLFDALDDEANWNEEEYGENKTWFSEEKEEQYEWNKLRDKVRKVGILVFGNQDSNAPLMMRDSILWRLAGQFRASWVPMGIKARFGNKYYDQQLERHVEGRYKTLWNLGRNAVPTLFKQIVSVFNRSIDPFGGLMTEHVEEIDGKEVRLLKPIQEYEKENMRRNLAGMSITLATLALIFMLRSIGADDDDEKQKLYRMLALNILIRSRQDLTFYADPSTAEQLLGNVVPSWSVIKDARRAVMAWSVFVEDDPDYWKEFWLKEFKAFPYVNNIPKLETMTHRDVSTIVR